MTSRWANVPVQVSGVAVTATAINSQLTTDAIYIDGAAKFKLEVNYTYAAATAVTAAIEDSNDNVTWGATQEYETASGVGVSYDAVLSKSVSASDVWSWTINAPAAKYLRFKINGTSANGSDVVALKGFVVKD